MKMQYSLTITCRRKHDSPDFPEDFAQSAVVCVSKNILSVTVCAGENGVILRKYKQGPKIPPAFRKRRNKSELNQVCEHE